MSLSVSIYDEWASSSRTKKGAVYWVFHDIHYETIGNGGIAVTHNGHPPVFELPVEALEHESHDEL